MKSSQFKSLEYSAMRRFKAPIEKFNSMEGYYDWAAKKCSALAEIDHGGRNTSIQRKRQAMKKDWLQFLTNSNNITAPVVLLIFSSMLKGLKDDNSDLLPQLNEDIFQKTLEATRAQVDIDKEHKFDFKKAYIKNLRQELLNESDTWIIIPSKKNDERNYLENLEKLKTLSPRTWCTKNDKAEDYLENCDIHIYYEKGSPELGIRIKDGKVYDIVGFENNGKIPQNYLGIAKNYIQEQNLALGLEAQDQIESAEYLEKRIMAIKADIGEAIDKKDVYKIMEYFGFKPEILNDGTISIIGYMQPRQGNFSDLGIDENMLFEKISEIRGNASFRNCAASSLKNIRQIGGDVNFSDSSILDTASLEKVGGNIYFADSKIKTIPNLIKVDGVINYKNSSLTIEELKERL